jgi:hypothetical protein
VHVRCAQQPAARVDMCMHMCMHMHMLCHTYARVCACSSGRSWKSLQYISCPMPGSPRPGWPLRRAASSARRASASVTAAQTCRTTQRGAEWGGEGAEWGRGGL